MMANIMVASTSRNHIKTLDYGMIWALTAVTSFTWFSLFSTKEFAGEGQV
jgi:hypothetical protein